MGSTIISGIRSGFFSGSTGLEATLFLRLTGGTMVGPLILYGDPTLPLEAATKQYVDANSKDHVSITLDMPAEFVVTGSPAAYDGTFTVTLADQSPHMVLAGPASSTLAAAPPSFRALVAADISDLDTVTDLYLLLSGGTMSGPLIVNDDVTVTGNFLLNGSPVVESAFGRTGAVTAQSGDYTADLVTVSPAISTWTNVHAALTSIDHTLTNLSRGMSYVGSYDAANNVATFVPEMTTLSGPLPAANATGLHAGDFLICTSALATFVGGPLQVGDQLISNGPGGGTSWNVLKVGQAVITAGLVPLSPVIRTWNTVQQAIQAISDGATQTPWAQNIDANARMLCSGAGNNLLFGTGAPASPTERLRITEDGDVIIQSGSLGVSNDLTVPPYDATPLHPTHLIVGRRTAPLDDNWGQLTLAGYTTGIAQMPLGAINFANYMAVASIDKRSAMIMGFRGATSYSGDLVFYTNPGTSAGRVQERARITSIGNVGIGNDASELAMSFVVPRTHLIVGTYLADTGVNIGRGGGQVTIAGNVPALNLIGTIMWANYGRPGADKRVAFLAGATGTTNDSGYLQFYTSKAGAFVEAMRITEEGTIGIGQDAMVLGGNARGWFNVGPNSAAGAGQHGRIGLSTFNATGGANSHIGGIQWGNYGLQDTTWTAVNADNKRLAGLYCYQGSSRDSAYMTFWTRNTRDPEDPNNLGNPVVNYPPSLGDIERRVIITQQGHMGIGNDVTSALYPPEMEEYQQGDNPADPTGTPAPRPQPKIHLVVGSQGPAPPAWTRLQAGIGELTLGTWSQTLADRKFGAINFSAFTVGDPDRRYASIEGYRGSNTYSAYITFNTRPNQPTRILERMRITQAGDVGIGNNGQVMSNTPPSSPTTNLLIGSASVHSPARCVVMGFTLSGSTWCGDFDFANYALTTVEKRISGIHGYTGTTSNSGVIYFNTMNAGVMATRMFLSQEGRLGLGNYSQTNMPAHQLQLNTDSAGKPGTNTWTIVSDVRTKRDIQPFEGGMEIIRQLEPTVAAYNGKAHMPDGMRVVSLDPVRLREVIPAAVSSTRGKLDEADAEETDILDINTHEIFYHLLRAVQQLDKRLEKLEL